MVLVVSVSVTGTSILASTIDTSVRPISLFKGVNNLKDVFGFISPKKHPLLALFLHWHFPVYK
jgi:hypothetical protein